MSADPLIATWLSTAVPSVHGLHLHRHGGPVLQLFKYDIFDHLKVRTKVFVLLHTVPEIFAKYSPLHLISLFPQNVPVFHLDRANSSEGGGAAGGWGDPPKRF